MGLLPIEPPSTKPAALTDTAVSAPKASCAALPSAPMFTVLPLNVTWLGLPLIVAAGMSSAPPASNDSVPPSGASSAPDSEIRASVDCSVSRLACEASISAAELPANSSP